jgi:hypothetical protein
MSIGPRAWPKRLHHLLGTANEHHPHALFLQYRQYTLDILEHAGMVNCTLCATPVDARAKVFSGVGAPVSDPTAYRSLEGGPSIPHLHQARHLLCCLAGVPPHA